MKVEPLTEMNEKAGAIVGNYLDNVWTRKEAGGLVCWSTSGGPNEVLRELGFDCIMPEVYGQSCATAGMSPMLTKVTDDFGYSIDLCSIIRCFTGFALSDPPFSRDELLWGGYPKPDIMFCSNYCPGLLKTQQEFARFYNVPMYVMDHPFNTDEGDDEYKQLKFEESYKQYKDMIAYFEDFSGNKLTDDMIYKVAKNLKESSQLWHDCLNLCQNVPSPMSFFDTTNLFSVFQFRKGTDECTEFYRELKENLEYRVEHQITSMPEDYRVLWFGTPVGYKIADHIKKFSELRAQPVISQWAFYFGAPNMNIEDDPLRGILEFHRKSDSPQFYSDMHKRKFIGDMIKNFKIDGMFVEIGRTCQVCNFDQFDIAYALADETGVPWVSFMSDMCDERLYSEDDFNAAAENLVQMMERRKASKQLNPA